MKRTLILAALAAALVLAPAAGAVRGVVGHIDFPNGSGAGQVRGLGAVAVNTTGAGGASPGDVYAADDENTFATPTRTGARIDQFSPAGEFIRAFGADVVASGPDQSNATQSVAVDAAGGTFTLSFGPDTTDPISFDAEPGIVEAALDELDSIKAGGGSVSVSGGPGHVGGTTPYLVSLDGGPLAGVEQPLLTAASGSPPLNGGASAVTVATTNPGATGFEICNHNAGDVCQAALGPREAAGIGGSLNDLSSVGFGPSSDPGNGIAIDEDSGDLSVVNGAAGRVERFSATGQFLRAWGRDVVSSGPGDSALSEQQTLALGANTTGGTFTLAFANRATVPIAFDAPASGGVDPGDSVQNALDALATIGGLPTPGSVSVSGPDGGPWQITFGGSLAGDEVDQIASDPSGLQVSSGTKSASVTIAVDGGGVEVCTQDALCKIGVDGSAGGAFGNTPSQLRGGLAVAPSGSSNSGDVLVGDSTNRRVQEFTPGGDFVRAFGFDVDATNPSTGFEVCTATSGDTCKAGTSGSGVGQMGALIPSLAEAPGGEIYVLSGRLQKLTPAAGLDLTPSLAGVDEAQTLTVNAAAGQFRLVFGTDPNGTNGTGDLTAGSATITNVVTTTGEFRVGQPLRNTSGGLAPWPDGEVLITAVGANTITVSQPSHATKSNGSAELVSSFPYTTGNLSATAAPPQVAAALNALPSINAGGGSVSVSGGVGDPGGNSPYTIVFDGGALARTDPPQITTSPGTVPLSGGSGAGADTATVATATPGGPNPAGLVAIGPAESVLVTRSYSFGAETCADGSNSPPEIRLQELSAGGSGIDETSMPCARLGSALGFASDPTTGLSYATTTREGKGYAYLFGQPGPPPAVTLNPPSSLTATAVRVSGTITPNGPGPALFPNIATTTYRVEYKKTSDSTWQAFSSDLAIGSGTTPLPFAVGVSGLQPNTPYEIRVVAVKPFGFAPVTATQTITTLAAPPSIEAFTSSNVTAGSADLHALINPLGSDTTYHFEYGTTPAYGQSTPEVDIGESLSPQPVQFHIDGLEPRVYHFRVVAHNVLGDVSSADQTFNFYPESCPNAAVRQQTGSDGLPDCRAYELVSPADAGTALLSPGGPSSPVATDPPRLAFIAFLGSIPGPWNPPSFNEDQYVASRTSHGWETHFVGFPADVTTHAHALTLQGLPADRTLGRFLQWKDDSRLDPYVFDSQGNVVEHWPTNLAEVPAAELGENQGGPTGATLPSPDYSHFFISSPGVAFAPGGLTSGPGSVYDDDVKAGTVTIASRLPGGGGDIPAEPGVNNAAHPLLLLEASTDGSHLLIGAGSGCGSGLLSSCPLAHLYMRVNAAVTYDVSQGHAVSYEGMAKDGSKVFFTTAEAIPGSGDTDTSVDLYMWSEATDSISRVSAGSGPGSGDTDVCSATWIAGCGVQVVPATGGGVVENTRVAPSTDNSIAGASGDVYFYSPEQFVGSNGIPARRNLYVFHDGQVLYVATLDADKPVSRIQVSADGAYAAFITTSRVTGYDNAGHAEMYRFNTGGEDLICVSCLTSGAPPPGDVEGSQDGIFMSDDGRTFFQTNYAVVPADTNEDTDVYEYVDGRIQLITSGTSIGTFVPAAGQELQPSGLIGVSANGTDVYFTSTDSLAGDRNGNFLKFYDARSGGGFAVPAQVAPCQAADECHGVGNAPIPPPSIGSTAELGSRGNVTPRHKRHRHQKKRRQHRHRGHSGRAGR